MSALQDQAIMTAEAVSHHALRRHIVTGEGMEPVTQRIEHHGSFHPGEMQPQTLVKSRRKTEVGIRCAIDAELGGIGEDLRIVVGRTHQHRDRITRADRAAVDFKILDGHAGVQRLSRRIPAQHLLNGRGDHAAVCPHLGVDVGMNRHGPGQGTNQQPQGVDAGGVKGAADNFLAAA